MVLLIKTPASIDACSTDTDHCQLIHSPLTVTTG
jgi:hypothetical protein